MSAFDNQQIVMGGDIQLGLSKASNGNRSAVHWDLVCIQRPECGGGEIRFDGKVIRKDGLFTVPALKKLNPENLGAGEGQVDGDSAASLPRAGPFG